MRKKLLFSLVFTAATLVCVTPYVHSNLSGAQGPYTSAPGELNCNTAGCHNDKAINSGGTLTMKLMDGNNEVNEWTAGKTYNVNVKVSKENISTYGFEISAKKGATSAKFGTFTAGTGTRVATNTANHITHNNPSSSGDWTFTWTAPASGSDVATFYVAGNAANGDNTDLGDYIYTLKKTFNASASSISESDRFTANTRILQNPVSQHLIVDFVQTGASASTLKVFTLQGKQIELPFLLQDNGENNRRFVVQASSLHKGMYIFTIQNEDNQVSKTFLKE